MHVLKKVQIRKHFNISPPTFRYQDCPTFFDSPVNSVIVLRLPTPDLQKPRRIDIAFGREPFNDFYISVQQVCNNERSAFFPFKAFSVWVFRVGVFRVRVFGVRTFRVSVFRVSVFRVRVFKVRVSKSYVRLEF